MHVVLISDYRLFVERKGDGGKIYSGEGPIDDAYLFKLVQLPTSDSEQLCHIESIMHPAHYVTVGADSYVFGVCTSSDDDMYLQREQSLASTWAMRYG